MWLWYYNWGVGIASMQWTPDTRHQWTPDSGNLSVKAECSCGKTVVKNIINNNIQNNTTTTNNNKDNNKTSKDKE